MEECHDKTQYSSESRSRSERSWQEPEQWQEREQSQEPERLSLLGVAQSVFCLLRSVRRPHIRASRDAPIGWGSAMNLDVDPFQSWVDRSWARAREIAAVDLAQRILLGTSRLWMRWARGLLSMYRRDLALIDWAEERGLVLYETSWSEDL